MNENTNKNRLFNSLLLPKIGVGEVLEKSQLLRGILYNARMQAYI